MFSFLGFLWFFRTAKSILFWLYLWQLKEYHTGRFFDHFNTEKGRKLLTNPLNVFKVILIILFFAVPVLSLFLLVLVYLIEFFKTAVDFSTKKIKRPVFTKKSLFLIFLAISLEIVFLIGFCQIKESIIIFAFSLLIFDVLTPIIVSILVLLTQPLAVLGRNRIIRKAKKKREEFKDLLVIGITGSYGKTSTKEFLYAILSQKFGENKVLRTKIHQNSEIGISQCILKDLKPEHKIFICEMGAYNREGIKLLCDITKPKIGILTGINEQHMATFGSQDNIIKTKFELIESLPENGIAIFNSDSAFIRFKVRNSKFKVLNQKFYSIKERADIWAENIKVERDSVAFRIFTKDNDSVDVKINVLGRQTILNFLGAALAIKELGITLSEIAKASEEINSKYGGMQLKAGKRGLNIIDSTYSANPDGVISALEYLKIWPPKRIIVMPCLIELGMASKEVHWKIGKKIGEVCDLAIITTKERFKEIKEGAVGRGMKPENILFIENPQKIFEKIKSFCEPGDVVLLESRVPPKLIELLLNV